MVSGVFKSSPVVIYFRQILTKLSVLSAGLSEITQHLFYQDYDVGNSVSSIPATMIFHCPLLKEISNQFSRKPKDMKRLARGYTSFDFIRNRILWSVRSDAHILGSPIPVKEIKDKYKTGNKRGNYRKIK